MGCIFSLIFFYYDFDYEPYEQADEAHERLMNRLRREAMYRDEARAQRWSKLFPLGDGYDEISLDN